MKFYEKYYANNYEELITYYPRFYRDVFEMVEILKAHGRLVDDMEKNIEQAFFNGFIDYADEATIAKLEKFLDIGLAMSLTIEERKRLVKSYFVGFGKISGSQLKKMISVYTDANVDVEFTQGDREGNNWLLIILETNIDRTIYMRDMLMLISKKIPAHIKWLMDVNYSAIIAISSIEKARVPFINLKYTFSFSYYCYIDGTWMLNGTTLLNGSFIPLKMRIVYGVKMIGKEWVRGPYFSIVISDIVSNIARASIFISGTVIKEYEDADAAIIATFAVTDVGESIETFLIQRKNLWYFNGEYILNGSRLLNAKIIEEAI